MRRAVVISVLIHLLALVSMFELNPWPTDSPRKEVGGLPLFVSFKQGGDIGQRNPNPAFRPHPMTAEVPPDRRPARMEIPASLAVMKQHAEKRAGTMHGENRLSPPAEVAESVVSLPLELEREYRISLAREARRSPNYPAGSMGKGQEGIVRMTIAYWSRLGRPTVMLEQSSGYRELDQEALQTVAFAIARVPLPEAAQGVSFRMQYALEYRRGE